MPGAHTRWCGALLLAASVAVFAPPHARATLYPGFLPTLVTDSSRVLPAPAASRPGYLVPRTDATFGTSITRIAENSGVPFGSISGTWAPIARHHYSKEQPWSADGRLIAIDNDVSLGLVLLDGETYQPLQGQCSGYPRWDDRWHPALAHASERINAYRTELMWYDVVRCVKTRTWRLPFAIEGIGMGEGNPSADGRFVALSDGARVFVVDMDPQPPYPAYPSQRIGPALDVSSCGLGAGCSIDWVTISTSGRYLVVSYDGDYPRIFDVNPTTLALTPRALPPGIAVCSGGSPSQGYIYNLGHADVALNPFDANEDVLVGQEGCGNIGSTVGGQLMGGIVMVRMRDGAITPLTNPSNEAYPFHVSTRNSDRPGWAYASYWHNPGRRFSDEVLAVKLDGSKSVQRFTHTRTDVSGCYECQAHPAPSRDGRRIIFSSNWSEDCTTCGPFSEIKDYVVDARGVMPNLVLDPSFESSLSGWVGYNGASLLRVVGGFEGAYALKISSVLNYLTFGLNDSPNWVQSIPGPGTTYRIEAWVRSDASVGAARLVVREFLGRIAKGPAYYSAPVTLSPTWQHLALNFTGQNAGGTVDVQVIDIPAAPGESFLVDNVSIRLAPSGTIGVTPTPVQAYPLSVSLAPNPVRTSTQLTVALPAPGRLRVSLFDLAGRLVRRIVDEPRMPAGRHQMPLAATGASGAPLVPGVYLCRVDWDDETRTQRFVVVR